MTSLKRSRDERSRSVSPSTSQESPSQSAKRQRLAGEEDTLHDLYQNIITVRVGLDACPFFIYKELACKDSAFFKTTFNSSFREATDHEVTLPEDDVEIFRIYQTWLNTGRLRYNFDGEEWWLRLAKVWIFADKLCSSRLKNKAIDAFFTVALTNSKIQFADADTMDHIYEHTGPESPLRRLLVRFFLHFASKEPNLAQYPGEFLAQVLEKIMSKESSWTHGVDKLGRDPVIVNKVAQNYHEDCDEQCCQRFRSRKTRRQVGESS